MSLARLSAWTQRLRAAGHAHADRLAARDALAATLLASGWDTPPPETQRAAAAAGPVPRQSELGRRPIPVDARLAGDGCLLQENETIGPGARLETAFGPGWNNSEDWGCWMGERFAWLHFKVDGSAALPLCIDLRLRTFFPAGGRRRLLAGTRERVVQDVMFDADRAEQVVRLAFGPDDVAEDGRVAIVLETSSIVSPSEAGSTDFRVIGFALVAAGLASSS